MPRGTVRRRNALIAVRPLATRKRAGLIETSVNTRIAPPGWPGSGPEPPGSDVPGAPVRNVAFAPNVVPVAFDARRR